MSNEEYFEQLCSNSIDGTLTDAEREKLEEHLAECPSCAALKADLEQMRALFLSEEEGVPETLHASIMQGLEQEAKLKVVQPEKPVRRLPVFTMVAAAAVVVVVVLGGGLGEIFGRVNIRGDASNASVPTETPIIAREVQGEVEEAVEEAKLQENVVPAAGQPNNVDAVAQPKQNVSKQPEKVPMESVVEAEVQEKMPMTDIAPKTNNMLTASTAPAPTSIEDTAPRAVGTLRMPESLRGKSMAHCYLASGTADLPDIVGELLLTEDTFSYFLMENSMTAIQDTLKALEDAGYSVSAYEGVGLTIDSKSDSWLLIISKT